MYETHLPSYAEIGSVLSFIVSETGSRNTQYSIRRMPTAPSHEYGVCKSSPRDESLMVVARVNLPVSGRGARLMMASLIKVKPAREEEPRARIAAADLTFFLSPLDSKNLNLSWFVPRRSVLQTHRDAARNLKRGRVLHRRTAAP